MSKRTRGKPHADNSRRTRLRRARKEARREGKKAMTPQSQSIPISPDMLFARIGRLDTEKTLLLEQNTALQQEVARLQVCCGETEDPKTTPEQVDAALTTLLNPEDASEAEAADALEEAERGPVGDEPDPESAAELRAQAIEGRAVGEAEAPPTEEQMAERGTLDEATEPVAIPPPNSIDD